MKYLNGSVLAQPARILGGGVNLKNIDFTSFKSVHLAKFPSYMSTFRFNFNLNCGNIDLQRKSAKNRKFYSFWLNR